MSCKAAARICISGWCKVVIQDENLLMRGLRLGVSHVGKKSSNPSASNEGEKCTLSILNRRSKKVERLRANLFGSGVFFVSPLIAKILVPFFEVSA